MVTKIKTKKVNISQSSMKPNKHKVQHQSSEKCTREKYYYQQYTYNYQQYTYNYQDCCQEMMTRMWSSWDSHTLLEDSTSLDQGPMVRENGSMWPNNFTSRTCLFHRKTLYTPELSPLAFQPYITRMPFSSSKFLFCTFQTNCLVKAL